MRPISPKEVAPIARDIAEGRWRITHQGAAFDDGGILVDGHHRLTAIVDVNLPVTMFVARGLRADDCAQIDRGRMRKVHIVLAKSHHLVAIARAYLNCVEGWPRYAQKHSDEEIIDAVSMLESLPWLQYNHRRGITAAVMGALVFAAQKYPLPIPEFVEQLRTGVSLPAGHPALTLRASLERRGNGGQAMQRTQAMIALAAARACVQRRPLTKLYVTDDTFAFFSL